VVLKAQGQYEEALKHLKKVVRKFPRDRVARNERGHLYMLLPDYERAIYDFEKVLLIDPEDLEAHYHLMRAYRAVGDIEAAQKAEAYYRRFKADEELYAVDRARVSAEALHERQPIHEHLSVPLPFDQNSNTAKSQPQVQITNAGNSHT
jgi:tetratricopeptide (TPR) repeat protein